MAKVAQGALIKDIMAHYSLSKATIYQYLGPQEA
jgi:transposase